MSEILIKGIEMPKGNNVLIVDSAGTITKLNTWTGKREATDPFKVKAIEVPTHGDLKDTNKILQWLNRICDEGQSVSVGEIIDYIENAPTIIEASEERV